MMLAANASNMESEVFADLALLFAGRPLYRYGMTIDEQATELLLKHYADKVCRVHRWRYPNGVEWNEAVLRFGETLFVHLENWGSRNYCIYSDSPEKAEELEKEIVALLPPPVKKPESPWFYMLRRDGMAFAIEKVNNKGHRLDDESLPLAYGEEALGWIEDFSKSTQAKSGGITILDGPPGTGKSTLIAELMRRLCQTHVFYVLSVGDQQALSDPKMVKFWQEQNGCHPNEVKVVVMEDAEKILFQRRSDNNESVSALLNIADGLLGQMLRVHVLCTLNHGMDQLDPAILRPGRLRSYRHVGFISRANAEELAARHKLPFKADPTRDKYTLAEVFNGKVYKPRMPRTLGFHVLRN
jgi:hypothetical protein